MIIVNARFLTQKVTGVQRFAIEISKRLKQLSEEFVFVCPDDILDHSLAKELNAIVIGKNNGTVWEQIDLRIYLISKNKPLLVNFCNTGLMFYEKQIVTIHDMSYKVNPQWFSKKFYLWYNFLIPHLANHSFKIFTVSNSSKKDIIEYLNIKTDKISVIYNSSNLITNNNFEPANQENYILSVSSLDPRKNLINLIEAFKQINKEVKLVIVGLKNNNFTLNNDLLDNDVEFKGYVSDTDLVSLMHNARAFVYISFYEGFGLPPIEAMQIGCPVIVSDIAAHREICGNAAIYANPNSVEEIKNRIEEVLSDESLRHELIIAGKENIKRFDWFQSANKVLKNINEVFEKYK